jgi:hypothetical protein
MNILQKINEIRRKVDYIKKDAKVQGYKAVSHDAVTAAVRDQLIETEVVIIPNELSCEVIDTGTFTSNGTPWIRFEAKYSIKFVNCGDINDFVCVEITSHAMDTGDKAPGKCISYATKYAILKIFNIETGDDDESRAQPDRTQKDILIEALEALDGSINVICQAIDAKELDKAVEAWSELSNGEKASIWIAPTKCEAMGITPPFTVTHRKVMRSDEWNALVKRFFDDKKAL